MKRISPSPQPRVFGFRDVFSTIAFVDPPRLLDVRVRALGGFPSPSLSQCRRGHELRGPQENVSIPHGPLLAPMPGAERSTTTFLVVTRARHRERRHHGPGEFGGDDSQRVGATLRSVSRFALGLEVNSQASSGRCWTDERCRYPYPSRFGRFQDLSACSHVERAPSLRRCSLYKTFGPAFGNAIAADTTPAERRKSRRFIEPPLDQKFFLTSGPTENLLLTLLYAITSLDSNYRANRHAK